jgi:hypothetical protein
VQSTCSVTPSQSRQAPQQTWWSRQRRLGLTQPVGGPSTKNPFGLWAAFSRTLGLALLFGVGRCGREWRPELPNRLALLCLLSIGVKCQLVSVEVVMRR